MSILVITNRSDYTSDFLIKKFWSRGIEFFRLNTDEYPDNSSSYFSVLKNSINYNFAYKDRKKSFSTKNISSIIYRRPIQPVPSNSIVDKTIRKYTIDECYEFLRGLWYSIDAFWISHPENIRIAEHKMYQLKIAASLSFIIPPTLITNDPQEFRDFYHKNNGNIVIKPLYSGYLDDKEPTYIFTSKIKDSDLDNLNDIIYAPSIFQKYIKKDYDLRVTVVGNEVFCAKITSKGKPYNDIDWRENDIEDLCHEPYKLPTKVGDLCIELVKKLNLEFGAIDFVVSNSNYYFLEINPNGQWAWIEHLLEFPISDSIADHLLENSNQYV